MTERHYLNSDTLCMETRVIRCAQTGDGNFEVVLSATLFHPQGGGQPADQGTIAGANVLRVTQAGDVVIHVCDRPVAEGDAHLEVLSAPRALHARLHSAGHLISHCGEQSGWRAVKGHHWPGEARVVFEADPGALPIDAEAIEQQANALVAADLRRHLSLDGEKRMIGFGHLPAAGCGGTHVTSSVLVGTIKILKVKEKKGQLWVHYDVDER
jgi:alanyl-tRNA synthetase